MLTRSIQLPCKSLSTIHTRKFFDYLRVANEVDAGKSVEQIESEIIQQQQASEATADAFSWNWLTWFEENNPEKYADYASIRSQYQQWEQYLGGSAGGGSTRTPNFSEYRSKISDPSFVDNLEIGYFVERDTISSISNMDTLNNWPEASISSFKAECDTNNDQLVRPLTSNDKAKQQQDLEDAELYDEKIKILSSEILKNFEQIDAERMMLGQDTQQMKLAEHPQYAETLEDMYAAKQTYLDYVMMPIHSDYVKRERLAQIQDEERRKSFLKRWEYSSAVVNGVDCSVPN